MCHKKYFWIFLLTGLETAKKKSTQQARKKKELKGKRKRKRKSGRYTRRNTKKYITSTRWCCKLNYTKTNHSQRKKRRSGRF